ncbi:MAG TPA: 2-oxoacid:acceptor oxidoreductase subunit alpha [Candidatus Eremiobacteraeota bacterium]|nr:MAG: 2-oxoglutarate oxidoreductase subunit KorA [bacterium ADurb.Bin363]HPZ08251.1 2-oxoacid:acceptor oxidoreductase subunit alpha [Candidatus Eremiobacteraeota bacterium]
MKKEYKLLQGNEACVEGALMAGVSFFGGYPITPSTEIAESLASRLPLTGGKFIQMEDEIGSIAAVLGASLTGAKAMTATSGPGFSLMQELIGFACITEIPCVIVNVQRLGPSTGGPTSPAQGDMLQARWGTHGDHNLIALCPTSIEETFYHTIKCFNLAEEYMVPVILLMDEVIGHMRERIKIPDQKELMIINRQQPSMPPEEYLPYRADERGVAVLANFGKGYRYHVTGLIHDETGFPTNDPKETSKLIRRINYKIENAKDKLLDFQKDNTEDAELIIFAYGSTARSALRSAHEAREQGMKVGTFIPKTIWPFPEKAIFELAEKVKTIMVCEMNLGQLVYEVERAVKGKARVELLSKASGELITPKDIMKKVVEVYN